MLYSIQGTLRFLGYDLKIPINIEAYTLQAAKDSYRKIFSNFYRMNDVIAYLKATNRKDILETIPPEVEQSPLLGIEDVYSLVEIQESSTGQLGSESVYEEVEVKEENVIESLCRDEGFDPSYRQFSISPVSVTPCNPPELEKDIKAQSSGAYKIKIVNHELAYIEKPKIEYF